mmetsp:Transcript_8155/g.17287  ORF Transcript_8155/g.17287 Transcript_8155/m.17287 type:complete len:219 (-) Transcript_8155:6-662(-)
MLLPTFPSSAGRFRHLSSTVVDCFWRQYRCIPFFVLLLLLFLMLLLFLLLLLLFLLLLLLLLCQELLLIGFSREQCSAHGLQKRIIFTVVVVVHQRARRWAVVRSGGWRWRLCLSFPLWLFPLLSFPFQRLSLAERQSPSRRSQTLLVVVNFIVGRRQGRFLDANGAHSHDGTGWFNVVVVRVVVRVVVVVVVVISGVRIVGGGLGIIIIASCVVGRG